MNILIIYSWIFGTPSSPIFGYLPKSCAVSQTCDKSEQLENNRERFWTDAKEDIEKILEENKTLRIELEKIREWYVKILKFTYTI